MTRASSVRNAARRSKHPKNKLNPAANILAREDLTKVRPHRGESHSQGRCDLLVTTAAQDEIHDFGLTGRELQ